MSKTSKKVRIDPGEVREMDKAEQALDRSEQLMHDDDVNDALIDIFNDVVKGFDNQADRADDIMDWWDVYNCVLGQKQAYNGNAQIFVPIVHRRSRRARPALLIRRFRKTDGTLRLFRKTARFRIRRRLFWSTMFAKLSSARKLLLLYVRMATSKAT